MRLEGRGAVTGNGTAKMPVLGAVMLLAGVVALFLVLGRGRAMPPSPPPLLPAVEGPTEGESYGWRPVAIGGGGLAAPRERILSKVDFLPADRAMFSLPPPAPPKPEPAAEPLAAPEPPPAQPKPKPAWRRWFER